MQTNGVAERFIRTLKEQVIYGRVFQNIQAVREAVRRFVNTYNREWRVEKNGFKSPQQARDQWLGQASLSRAA
jgi:putative transposase